MSVTADYAEAVLRRAREPMEPFGFEPDWNDRPYRSKVYADTARIELPQAPAEPTGPLGGACDPPEAPRPFDMAAVSEMLRTSYGVLSRRLRLTGNQDSPMIPWFEHATWSRGTASGGGLYSAEIYWVAGPRGPLAPGVYHYSYPHHALDRLLLGDVSAPVRDATAGHPAAQHTDQFLLLGVKFWKNAFKYNSFCYHVVTMDVGTLLGTWNLWCGSTGRRIDPALWFDEESLDDLLGLDPADEGVLGVVPLDWAGTCGDDHPPASPAAPARVRRAELERSRTVVRFPQITEVHMACRAEGTHRPAAADLLPASPRPRSQADPVALPDPPPAMLDTTVGDALRQRCSSFGAFLASPPLARSVLSGILDVGARGARPVSEVTGGAGPDLTRLMVCAGHVEGLPPGVYDHVAGALRPVAPGPVGRFLQWNYFLSNYNLEQAGATIAVLGRPAAVVAAAGDRGYRALNAEVGAVAQAVYTAAAAAGVGCGAVLGFDNVAIAEHLGLDGTDEWPLLLIMVGHERPTPPDIDSRLD